MFDLDQEEFLHLLHFIAIDELGVKDYKEKDVMKLFLCRKCHDVVKCDKSIRKCKCGQSIGYYQKDGIHAVFSGPHCLPIAIDNNALIKAIQMADIENKHQNTPTTCKGVDFKAFVLLDCVTSITKK